MYKQWSKRNVRVETAYTDTRLRHDTHLMAIIHDNPGKLVPDCLHSGFIASKDDGVGGDNWSCKTPKGPVKSSQPKC